MSISQASCDSSISLNTTCCNRNRSAGSSKSTLQSYYQIDNMANSVKTFVFLDLEATGLNNENPKITEICLVAIHVSSLENSVTNSSGHPQLPRILDKLSLCVDPGKPINGIASQITGLSNTNLGNNEKQHFNSCLFNIVSEFLIRQAQPVCLVAHNGFNYDYPLLKSELQQQNIDLPSSLLCMDSLKVFQNLDNQGSNVERKSYALPKIYERFFGEEPVNSHYAEGDVLTLIMVFLSKTNQILETVSTQFKNWGEIKSMY
ncbi:three prime repair exonuclease 2-like isoform X2 [Pelobates fuscus]|uniref:three prime repair exonuclease 2-like isoform X2 n=1 Tax=Pelobates fuscus TaxID=191477 RepID=UPI002FE4636D